MYLKDTVIPREYQQSIANNIVKFGSSLVVLPTGLGKTLIAIIVISKILEKNNDAKILFLAPTKPLVEQHTISINKSMQNIKIAQITGTIKPKNRLQIINENNIIVATPQTIENDLNLLDKNKFNLIVFDECHRATGNYAYVRISKHFENTIKLGMSASPGTTKSEIKEIMQNINAENLEIRTENDSDVSLYVNDIKINWVKVDLPLPLQEINKLLKEFKEENGYTLRRYGIPLRNGFTQKDLIINQRRIFEMLKEKNPRPELYQAISTISAIMKIEHAIILLETQGLSALREYLSKLYLESEKKESKAAVKITTNEKIKKAKYILESLNMLDIEHPKIKKLEEIILSELNKDPEQKIIVFNHYRDSVQFLEKELNKNPIISAKRFVGQANKGEDKGFSQKEQKEIIEDFREGKYNVLVASSVAEEGLDIPSVDTIIFYEPVPSDIRSVQRRGRTGRFREGQVYILITRGTRDETFYYASNAKEKNMINSINELSKKETTNEKIKKIENMHIEQKPKEKTIKQKLITDIIKEEQDVKKNSINIFVDNREKNSKTYNILKQKICEIFDKQLEIGDYQVGEEVIIERKTISDFINSIIDGRLFMQAVKLNVYEKPLILIEGNLEEEIKTRNIRIEQIYGVIFSLMFEFKIPVIFVNNSQECANIIYQLAKKEQLGKNNDMSLRKLKKTDNTKLMQQYILEGLPHIGPTIAKRLIEKYGSIKKIFNLDEDKLEKNESIGKKKAKDIYDIINHNNKVM